MLSLFCGWITLASFTMGYDTIAKVVAVMTFYMTASTTVYIALMVTYKPPTHLNYDSESDDSDSEALVDPDTDDSEDEDEDEDEDDYMNLPPLVPISQNEDRVLRQLRQVVDETNDRNQMRITRSMYARAAANMDSEPSFKKLN